VQRKRSGRQTKKHCWFQLRHGLDEVASHKGLETWPSKLGNLSLLVGAYRSTITQFLGSGVSCAKYFGAAGCEERTSILYEFFRLPPGSVGGGPTLVVRFDQNDRCFGAFEIGTQ
jgi:hypothetical protein